MKQWQRYHRCKKHKGTKVTTETRRRPWFLLFSLISSFCPLSKVPAVSELKMLISLIICRQPLSLFKLSYKAREREKEEDNVKGENTVHEVHQCSSPDLWPLDKPQICEGRVYQGWDQYWLPSPTGTERRIVSSVRGTKATLITDILPDRPRLNLSCAGRNYPYPSINGFISKLWPSLTGVLAVSGQLLGPP